MSSEPTITPSGGTAVAERIDEQTAAQQPWVTLVWDDPVNLMSYVTHVFRSYFGFPREKAEQLMLQVHNEGKCVVSSGGREQMERDVNAMHGYGLWATMEHAE
ncbi:ATP-dependent Clp protease adapter ClpS [Luteococcus sp. H154]|uniref:ATP-dependent Clp protease adapter ClpS n=1 Tax=unclassified Luteococcus TaxID=2639923 RepID=UPI00313EB12E